MSVIEERAGSNGEKSYRVKIRAKGAPISRGHFGGKPMRVDGRSKQSRILVAGEFSQLLALAARPLRTWSTPTNRTAPRLRIAGIGSTSSTGGSSTSVGTTCPACGLPSFEKRGRPSRAVPRLGTATWPPSRQL